MPLYEVDDGRGALRLLRPSAFEDVDMQERKDLQALLRDTPAAIDPDLFVFAEEFGDWQESTRRVDLMALDRDANLVVVELKRVAEGGHMELQAIRYAAMVSTMDFEAVVRAYEKMLSNPDIAAKRGTEPSSARQELLAFLEITNSEDVAVSSATRIVLMAPSFSKEITTTVLWLNDQGLDVRCLEVRPYQTDGKLYLNVEQTIPLPSADAYIVQQREKAVRAESQAKTKRGEQSIPTLAAQKVLTSGTRLRLIKPPRPELQMPSGSAWQATFVGPKKVRWDYDEEEYTLSALCLKICEQFGGEVRSGAFPGPDFWAIEGEQLSLADLARSIRNTDSTTSYTS